MNLCIHEFMNLWIYEFTNVWMNEFMNLRIHEFMNLCMNEFMNARIHEFMTLWIYESMNLSLYEFYNTPAILERWGRRGTSFHRPARAIREQAATRARRPLGREQDARRSGEPRAKRTGDPRPPAYKERFSPPAQVSQGWGVLNRRCPVSRNPLKPWR